MRGPHYNFTIFVFLCILFTNCQRPPSGSAEEDTVVAEVGNRKLYLSELNNVIHPTTSFFDSTALANAYIDQWIRDQLLMKEASKFFSSDFEIEKLVNDYREKLIKFNLEEKIIQERYDTLVTRSELEDFYQKNQGQFLLIDPMYRCVMAKIPVNKSLNDQFYKDWREDRMPGIEKFLVDNGGEYLLEEDKWLTWAEISSWTEVFSESRARQTPIQRVKDDEYEFFLKVLEFRDKKEISPLSIIEYRLKLMILQKRKHQIIEDYKQELYEKALESNLIKI